MLFNTVEGPLISAVAGLGITHTGDLLVTEYVARGELKLILEDFAMPGPPHFAGVSVRGTSVRQGSSFFRFRCRPDAPLE